MDIERLRNDILNDFYAMGSTGLQIGFMLAMEVESATPEELIQIAIDNGYDLEKYKIKTR